MENEYFASINDVSKRLSVPAHTLRYWEKQFPLIIRPTTGAGGRRYYRADMVDKLVVIRDLLYKHGLTIAGVKKLLHDGNFPSSADEFIASVSDGGNASQPAQSMQQTSPRESVSTFVQIQSAPRVDTKQIELAISLLNRARELLKN